MGGTASEINSLAIIHSTVYTGADQRKHKSTASLLFAGNSPVTGEFPAQMASYAENVSIWWRHHVLSIHAMLIDSTPFVCLPLARLSSRFSKRSKNVCSSAYITRMMRKLVVLYSTFVKCYVDVGIFYIVVVIVMSSSSDFEMRKQKKNHTN